MTGSMAKPLNGKQTKALSALLCSPTLAAAAKLSGIPERSLYRYLRTPHFADAYRDARSEQVRQAMAQVQRVALKAVLMLEQVLTDPLARGSTRVMACKTVLECAVKATELESIEGRLVALETTEPKLDLSKLNNDEWELFKTLRAKMKGAPG